MIKQIALSPGESVTADTFKTLNPLAESKFADDLSTPGGIISRFLTIYLFPLAGIILFAMLIWGGVEIMMGAVNKKSLDAGKQRVTSAIIGFVILFIAFWLAQLLEIVFGIKIL